LLGVLVLKFKKLSIIIPAYNEEKTIEKTLTEVKKVSFKDMGFEKEIIMVDDGSKDNTVDITKKFPWVKIISHKKNRGKGAAIKTGLKECSGEVFVIQDADMEVLPSEIRKLLEAMIKGNDVVYGSRFKNKGRIKGMKTSFFIGNKLLSLFTKILFGTKITDMETCFKMSKTNILRSLNLESDSFDIEPEITAKLLKKGYKILEIPITYRPRESVEKKIQIKDGLIAFKKLIEYRFFN